ncbi:hypothetical protein ACQJBY_061919 [Aegilops geniculata]
MAATLSPIIGVLLILLPLASSSSYIKLPLGGKVHPEGHFYVTMNIGVPAKTYFLGIDTGSNLTWLGCKHSICKNCKGPHKPYHSKKPHNFVKRRDPLCCQLLKDLPGHNKLRCTRKGSGECHYKIRYFDGKSSEGVVARDMVTLHPASLHQDTLREQIDFGCGYNQQPWKSSFIDGILGLGKGRVSFFAQLKAHKMFTKDIIGHCLSINGGGYLFVGDYNLPTGITWAPMRKQQHHYYTPGPGKLSIEGKHIGTDKLEVVFDSGATYTYVPDQTYNRLLAEVKTTVSKSLSKVQDALLPVCWKGSKPIKSIKEIKGKFKPLSLEFDNKAVMHIRPENYLVHTTQRNVCLGILNGSKFPEGQMMRIGDVSMQDLLVIYDKVERRIGWVSKSCPTPEIPSTHVL